MNESIEKDKILGVVERYIHSHELNDLELEILRDSVRHSETYWYVPVKAVREPARHQTYFEALAEIETDIDEQEHLKIVLLPS